MAFTTAATAKTASDAAEQGTNGAIGSLTETLVNAEIVTASTKTGLLERLYSACICLDADLNGGTSPVDIVQSDDSLILLTDLTAALISAGYRVSVNEIKTREGINDKVKLQIAWD